MDDFLHFILRIMCFDAQSIPFVSQYAVLKHKHLLIDIIITM